MARMWLVPVRLNASRRSDGISLLYPMRRAFRISLAPVSFCCKSSRSIRSDIFLRSDPITGMIPFFGDLARTTIRSEDRYAVAQIPSKERYLLKLNPPGLLKFFGGRTQGT